MEVLAPEGSVTGAESTLGSPVEEMTCSSPPLSGTSSPTEDLVLEDDDEGLVSCPEAEFEKLDELLVTIEEATWAKEKTPEGAARKRELLEEIVSKFGTDEAGLTDRDGAAAFFSRMPGIDESDPQYMELLQAVGGVPQEAAMGFLGTKWHIVALEYLLEATAQ